MLDPQLIIDETGSEQPKAARGHSADDGRKVLRDLLERVVEQALSWHDNWRGTELKDRPDALHTAIRITTGVGKSEQLRKAIARFVIEAKARSLPHRVLVPLPTHRLADEARDRMPDGIITAVWQGRGATKLGTDEAMCLNPGAVEAALEIGAEVEETACKRKEARCPFYSTCHYQAQKAPAKNADVVFAAHEVLFQTVEAIGKGFGLIVIDESFWQDGIVNTRLAIAGLGYELGAFPVRDHFGNRLDVETMHLRELIERLQGALARSPDGYVRRVPLIEAGLLPATQYEDSSCTAARKLEWKRKVANHGLLPGASDEERKEAVKQFGFIGQLPRRAAMWHALDKLITGNDDATGRLRIESNTTDSGTVRWLWVTGHKDIVEKLTDLPLIHADATMPFELVGHYLPNLQLVCDLNIAGPHMRITQVIGLPVGKTSLKQLPPGKRRDDQENRVGNKRRRLVDAVRQLVRGRRRGLVITYKDIEDDFRSIEGIEVAHFGAIEGIDRWNDVDVAVVIGRPLPRPQDIDPLAAAVTGRPVIAGAMIQGVREIRPGHTLKCRVYGVPEAEMIRQAVTEAAVVQAVGRARGVNRTAANPVEVFLILSDTVVPGLPIDEVIEFRELEPDAIDEMVARGLVPQFGADAARLHPDLFPTRQAAKKAIQRSQLNIERGMRRRSWGSLNTGTTSYRYISIRECPRVRAACSLRLISECPCVHRIARYQPTGRYQKTRLAQIDLIKVPHARAVLEAALGKLVLFELLDEPGSIAAEI